MPERIYLSPPDVGPAESRAALKAMESGWITTLGPSVTAFEADMQAYTGAGCAVALSSGTAALHLALLGLGVTTGDEVLVSTLTFAATANAVAYCGAVPVFIDSEADSWNMDPTLLEEELGQRSRDGRLPAAVIAVDVFGQCADYGRIEATCRAFGVPLVEDAAESLGAVLDGRNAGTFGTAAVLSFNGNKIMTTSGGGMLLTDDERLARRARHLATQAREPVPHYEHRDIGYNYRLSNVLAAIGTAQLARLPDMIVRRMAVREMYRSFFADVPGAQFQGGPPAVGSNAWLTAVTLPGGTSSVMAVIAALDSAGIEARRLWKPMHLQPVFAGGHARLTGVSDDLFARGVCLPSGSAMSDDQVERVISVLARVLPSG